MKGFHVKKNVSANVNIFKMQAQKNYFQQCHFGVDMVRQEGVMPYHLGQNSFDVRMRKQQLSFASAPRPSFESSLGSGSDYCCYKQIPQP